MRFFIICLLGCLALGCDGFLDNAPVDVSSPLNPSNPPASSPPPDEPQAPSVTSEWGILQCHHTQIEAFNVQLKKFLSGYTNPANMTSWLFKCSKQSSWKGGVWIRGNVSFTDGLYSHPFSQNLSEISEDSYLELHIVNSQELPIAILKMTPIPYGSKIEGSHITLGFQDAVGKIFLSGPVAEDGVFSGDFIYENLRTWQGTAGGYTGNIGRFSIPICSLLDCSTSP